MDRFIRRADPRTLSVRDLLEARDQYHVHIANLPTVIGTAMGRYRIRLDDPNYADEHAEQTGKELGPRTLDNSNFRPWSWPCVLVFVTEWLDRKTLSRHPELAVPPVLYLPDGRQVRTCPVLVQRRVANLPPADTALYAADKFGPNFQVHVADQGATRMGVASAIVEDGACAFALVSRHVTSGTEPGAPVFALPRGKKVGIGHITLRSVDALPLADIYPGFAGRDTRLTLDAALVKLDSIGSTNSQYLGVGGFGPVIDLSSDKMSLNLIGCPLFTELPGGIRTEGCVHGLFYRHASVGGVDALAEFLIGPRRPGQTVQTRPGDSGAVWFWDEVADRAAKDQGAAPPVNFRPLAVQWGGHGFGALHSNRATEFALATGFSSLCKALNVELVEDWRSGQSRYWGKVGHYNIGYAACFALQTAKAKAVFKANATAIGVSDEDITAGKLPGATQTSKFIALADVPDLVWRSTRGKDKANHFADMDEPGRGPAFQGRTLIQLWQQDPASRDPQVWDQFYSSIDPARKPAHRGALPFRVAELYKVMVQAAAAKQLDAYVCAAGVLAHYIGDACQPLHVSQLHHGQPDDADDDKVHAVYEDDMLNQAADEVVVGVKQRVGAAVKRPLFTGPMAAADAVVQLMRRTIEELPPEEVLEVYRRVHGRGQSAAMWAALGERTMNRMADGALTLATVWQSAWKEGKGEQNFTAAACKLPVPTVRLKKLYDTKGFAESHWLHEMTLAGLA
ncbi:hypothetical protein [Pelomonas sp. Root1237]|uniref:hypothetical protein n=1 Tax=Pelomonas sp. Root1237 TaxID=1736434 RepID=UPI0006F5BB86|nr:hypothetical protein [Pelomonas sp. Root1237]KQV88803.1 hypothetical protein ASC91_09030 [Pelomonas sp. Root1237]